MNSVLSNESTGSSVQKKPCMPGPHMPSPMVSEILSYLPFKTVVQYKTVSKEWKNLISEPGFAKSHFSKSPRGLFIHSDNCEISGNVLHFVDPRDSLRFKFCGDIYIPHKAIVGRFLSTKIEFGKCFISSCNGLLCFCETDPKEPDLKFYICNPVTRDYIIIPPLSDMSSYGRNPDLPEEHWRSEFGFSPKTGQFKVLRLRLSFKQKAKIFTLGQCSWRSIDIPSSFIPYGTTAFLNGTLHWLSFRGVILSFDVGAETFHEFPFPTDLDDDKSTSYDYSLGVLKECISLCRANYEKGQIEIWMLKEYGVTESWIKQFVIEDAGKFVKHLQVRWVMEDGDKGQNVLLVCTRSTVLTYDPAGGDCRFIKFEGLWGRLTLFPHILSLTPLKDVVIFDGNSKDEEEEAMSPERKARSRMWSIRDLLE